MTSHADCTHEKTKAARAACRAGKAEPKRLINPDDYPIMQRVDSQTGEPIGPPVDLREKAEGMSLGRQASKHHYVSGHCSTSNHDRCAIVYANTACTCSCHSES